MLFCYAAPDAVAEVTASRGKSPFVQPPCTEPFREFLIIPTRLRLIPHCRRQIPFLCYVLGTEKTETYPFNDGPH